MTQLGLLDAPKSGAAHNKGKSKQDYATPPEFVAAVARRFGPITWDLAATAENTKAPLCITPEQDSFSVRWHTLEPNGVLWLNPPFAHIAPWAQKCGVEAMAGARVIMLTPASVGTEWYADHVFGVASSMFIRPRLQFVGKEDPYPKDLMLSLFGFDGLAPFECWRWK